MKNVILTLLLMVTIITYGQKKKNGTIYLEHPAIITVEAMTQAFVMGDSDKVASYLADDFKAFNGTSTNKDNKGSDKESFLKGVNFWNNNVDYFSITRSEGAYPDALEYKKDNKDDEVWVQTWEDLKGVHSKTGVKIDMPLHRLIIVNKDNKIKSIMQYDNNSIFDEVGDSFGDRKNGQIYNHHEYINVVRKMIYAFENKDYEKAYGFYDDKVRFSSSNMTPDEKPLSLTQMKEDDKKFFEKFEITSVDVSGYPDYLHYEMGGAKVVQSWWDFRLIRKSDKKSIVLPVFYIHNFNDDGKITSELIYYSENILEK